MKAKATFFAIALGLASPLAHAAGCIVENDEIEIVGELSRETFAGPPNYENVHKGDKAETHWILTAYEPIALCPFTSANGESHTVGSVRRFQLVLGEGEQRGLKQALIARHALVRGRILMGRSGHHYTAAVIEVTELE